MYILILSFKDAITNGNLSSSFDTDCIYNIIHIVISIIAICILIKVKNGKNKILLMLLLFMCLGSLIDYINYAAIVMMPTYPDIPRFISYVIGLTGVFRRAHGDPMMVITLPLRMMNVNIYGSFGYSMLINGITEFFIACVIVLAIIKQPNKLSS